MGLTHYPTERYWSRRVLDTRVTAPTTEIQALRRPKEKRRNMKTSTKDKIKGSFHKVKGTIKEEVGKWSAPQK